MTESPALQSQAFAERLFQDPMADALTRAGQIAKLCRMGRLPMKDESYFVAGITDSAH
jgi:hypothetical protein